MDENPQKKPPENTPILWLLPVLESDTSRTRLGEHLKEAVEYSFTKSDKYDPAEVRFYQRSALVEARRIHKSMGDLIAMLERPAFIKGEQDA